MTVARGPLPSRRRRAGGCAARRRRSAGEHRAARGSGRAGVRLGVPQEQLSLSGLDDWSLAFPRRTAEIELLDAGRCKGCYLVQRAAVQARDPRGSARQHVSTPVRPLSAIGHRGPLDGNHFVAIANGGTRRVVVPCRCHVAGRARCGHDGEGGGRARFHGRSGLLERTAPANAGAWYGCTGPRPGARLQH